MTLLFIVALAAVAGCVWWYRIRSARSAPVRLSNTLNAPDQSGG